MFNKIAVFTDGGSRGNPGPAAYGVSIVSEGKELTGFGKILGITTNNVAEYSAVLAGYEWLLDHPENLSADTEITFTMDSLLVCMQMLGKYKIKHPGLIPLYRAIKEKELRILKEFHCSIMYVHVPRRQNKRADYFVNKALDEVNK